MNGQSTLLSLPRSITVTFVSDQTSGFSINRCATNLAAAIGLDVNRSCIRPLPRSARGRRAAAVFICWPPDAACVKKAHSRLPALRCAEHA
jgi:hypothetical protein